MKLTHILKIGTAVIILAACIPQAGAMNMNEQIRDLDERALHIKNLLTMNKNKYEGSNINSLCKQILTIERTRGGEFADIEILQEATNLHINNHPASSSSSSSSTTVVQTNNIKQSNSDIETFTIQCNPPQEQNIKNCLSAGDLDVLPPEILVLIANFVAQTSSTTETHENNDSSSNTSSSSSIKATQINNSPIYDLLSMKRACKYLQTIGQTVNKITIRITNKTLTSFDKFLIDLSNFLAKNPQIKTLHVDVSNTNITNNQLARLLALPQIQNSMKSLNATGCNNITSLSCNNVTKITALHLPNSLTWLSCDGCTGLTSLQLPNSLTMFSCNGCTGLTSLHLPNGLTTLYCNSCTGLTALQLPNSLTELLCSGCTWLTSLQLPNGLATLSCNGCTGLTSLQLPNGLATLSCNDCTGLTALQLPNSLTQFSCNGCTGFTALQLPDRLTELFCSGCTGLTALQLPNSLKWLSCNGCTGLTTATLHFGQKKLEAELLKNCPHLKDHITYVQ